MKLEIAIAGIVLFFFERDTKENGNYFELHEYKGRKHYLGEGNPKYSRYFDDEILSLADEFLRKQNLLDERAAD